MSESLEERVARLERQVAALISDTGRLGPQPESESQIAERAEHLVEAVGRAMPPVDRSKLCTTNGKPVDEVRAGQTNETGQHDGYIVLCAEERAKGFVRPYRDSYKHLGRSVARCLDTKQDGTDERPHQCERERGHEGDHEFSALMIINSPVQHLWRREGGCGTVTTMGRALSETYARDPTFYSHTFCVRCNQHLPVAEFVWTADGQQVGS